MGIYDKEIEKYISENQEVFLKMSKNEQKKFFKKIYNDVATNVAKELKTDLQLTAQLMIKNIEKENKYHIKHIKKIWNPVFNILDQMLEIVSESMECYSKEFAEIADREHNLTYHAIRTIHARVVLCFKESLLLLKHGYSEGVVKIWRTMYELTIIAMFLEKHRKNENLAQKYIDHIIVDEYKEELEYRKQKGVRKRYTDKAFRELTENYNNVIFKYGENFKKDYGWANDILKPKSPNFSNIESNINRIRLHPYYKSSCYEIHGNYKSNINKIGLIENNVLLYGPTDYGLSEPCQNIAITLNQISAVFFTIYPSLDYIVTLNVLNLYLEELLPLANSIQKSIENDLKQ